MSELISSTAIWFSNKHQTSKMSSIYDYINWNIYLNISEIVVTYLRWQNRDPSNYIKHVAHETDMLVTMWCKLVIPLQYIPRNMHTVFDLLCFVVVIHWLIFPYPSGLLHWHCGNLTIAPVPAKQPWWIWINTSCEFIMNDCITTTKQSTTKPCAYFLGYTVCTMFKWKNV